MKILYGVQGTGLGHISRATALLPELCKHAEVDVLISGYAFELELGNVAYRKRGISLKYDRNGGVAMLETLKQFKPIRFLNDVQSIPLQKYDLVISDYEPISSWATRIAGVRSVALSHQAAFILPKTPRPEKESIIAEQLLQRFAPSEETVGFHFKQYDNFIEPQLIRDEIQDLNPIDEGHITVYLPAWHPAKLAKMFHKFPQVDWHIFSSDCKKTQQLQNVWLRPVSHGAFLKSGEACGGVMTSSGFEMCSEAMYLGKKLLVIPIRNQYEQLCNAAALQKMGVTVLSTLEGKETVIDDWLENGEAIGLNEIADAAGIVERIINEDLPNDAAAGRKVMVDG